MTISVKNEAKKWSLICNINRNVMDVYLLKAAEDFNPIFVYIGEKTH